MRTIIKCVEKPNNKLLLRLKEDGKYMYELIEFDNFLYVSFEDFQKLKKNDWLLKLVQDKCKRASAFTAKNGNFVKLVFKENSDRYFIHSSLNKNRIKTYEGDITAAKRWLLNEGPKYDFSNYSVLYLDIETDDRGSFDKDNQGVVIAGNKQITSVALEDQEGKQYYFRNENADNVNGDEEYEMLNSMCRIISKYDIISAWNGYRFDFPYISQRMEFHELKGRKFEFDLHLVNKIDEMEKYKKYTWTKHERYALEKVSNDTLGDGKIDFSDDVAAGRGRFFRLYKEQPEKFKEYNLKDVTLMRRIDEKFKMYQTLFATTELTKTLPEEAMFTSFITDNGMIRLYHDHNYICPSKPSNNELEARKLIHIGGGFTWCYSPGFHQNIEVFDYKSHYPLVIMTFDISNETWVCNRNVNWLEVREKCGDTVSNLLQCMHEYKIDKKIISAMKEKYNISITSQDMTDAMFEFVDKYEGETIRQYAIENKLIYTPADINRDTIGWHLHPHRLYTQEKGALPQYVGSAVVTRDKTKYIFAQKCKDKNFIDTDEYFTMRYKDFALKTVANGAYGFTGLRSSRFFDYNVADAITATARWITKKSLLYARSIGFDVVQGDTDSIFLKNISFAGDAKDADVMFFKYFDTVFSNFNIPFDFELKNVEKWVKKEKGEEYEHLPDFIKKKYYCLLEHEKTFPAFISVAKKRYYYLKNDVVDATGGAFIKSDTNPLARDLQKQLCEDILRLNFNKKTWYELIKKYKEECFSHSLDEKYLIFRKSYQRHYSEYGGNMTDADGNVRKTAAGKIRTKAVPCQIELVKRLSEAGLWDGEVGDLIVYIIGEPQLIGATILFENTLRKKVGDEKVDILLNLIHLKQYNAAEEYAEDIGAKFRLQYDTRQRAITVDEYRAGEKYDANVYWNRIITPLIEILHVYDKKVCYEEFGDLWGMSEKQVDKMLEGLGEE